MFTAEEATKERVEAYVAALEKEIADYEARVKRIELGRKDPLVDQGSSPKEAADQVRDRIKQCKAEIARVKKVKAPAAAAEAAEDEA